MEFGKILIQARLDVGMAGQVELAAALGVSQQTVSRWEQGKSRPRAAQIPALAAALNTDAARLLSAAGYAEGSSGGELPSSSRYGLDLPWPVDALPYETFERFCADLLDCLHGDAATVTRYGSQGHKQNGLDIDAVFGDGSRTTYQCKRQKSLGPTHIAKIVKDHKEPADKKVILFSGIASPQAREKIKSYRDQGWELWDREDITRRARLDLDRIDQLRLVDVYFPGQRRQLLGELEPSPWRRPEEFFAGMTAASSGNVQPWTYAWELVGRSKELEVIRRFVEEPGGRALLLIGNGGSGKTRLLKAVCDAISKDRRVFFLPRDATAHPKDFEAFGNDPKVLISDDAHDRDDLGRLAEYVADPSHQARLILSLRPYGRQRVDKQIRALRSEDSIPITLPPLNKDESERLAQRALRQFGGDRRHVERLAAYTRDCPLATVIGAKVLASGVMDAQFLGDESQFRGEFLRHIVSQTVSGVSSGLNEPSLKTVLAAIAMLQPIRDSDPDLIEGLARLAHISRHEVAQILKRLHDASVLYKRGYESRLIPDLMGDFLIEEQGVSAEDVFDHVPDRYAEQILLNQGRLDWRRSNGDTDRSQFLDPLWSRLLKDFPVGQSYLRAAAAVAFYQPKQALAFAHRVIEKGQRDELLAQIARNASMGKEFDHMAEACELLWQLGQNDTQSTNQQPSHGIRVLSEMASPMPGKPIGYIEQVVAYGLELLRYPKAWTGAHTPLEFLTGVLATEGHTTEGNNREIRMRTFFVSPEGMARLRRQVIDACIRLLSDSDVSHAIKAAQVLGGALRFPVGLFGAKVDQATQKSWDGDFLQTLHDLLEKVETGAVPATVAIKLASNVRWHAQHGTDEQRALAEKIMAFPGKDLRSRTILKLLDGWGHLTAPLGGDSWQENLQSLQAFAQDLLQQFTDPEALYAFLRECLGEIQASKTSDASSQLLLQQLVEISTSFARLLLDHARPCNTPDPLILPHVGIALAALMRAAPEDAYAMIQTLLASDDQRYIRAVAEAYCRHQPTDDYTDEDRQILKRLALSVDPMVHRTVASALFTIARKDYDLAVELVVAAEFDASPEATHDYLMWLSGNDQVPFHRLTEEHIRVLLEKLEGRRDIGDYWILAFLKKVLNSRRDMGIQFLKARMFHATRREDWTYRPIPWGATNEVSSDLAVTPHTDRLLRELFQWAVELEEAGSSVLPWFGDFIKFLFGTLSESLRGLVLGLASSATQIEIDVLTCVLREVPYDFIFTNSNFVRDLLRTAKFVSDDALEQVSSALYASSVSGVRHGLPGKPFPRDLMVRDEATKLMESMGRFDPAYKLYQRVRESAMCDIERQVEEGRIMDEQDDSEFTPRD
ncbi:helix-turn-helix domain-containing protein [Rhodanobacter sp. 7MK24]|uniref:helix-turn-helix domain-containing protein n=1 Tax=Rhodanobacter sp. 7MK24 TaxID=2775922 RepID=UPI00177DFEE1